ncbi:MAG: hypothetical protein J07HB67_02383, partial [halophilic archaeon J07HB67]
MELLLERQFGVARDLVEPVERRRALPELCLQFALLRLVDDDRDDTGGGPVRVLAEWGGADREPPPAPVVPLDPVFHVLHRLARLQHRLHRVLVQRLAVRVERLPLGAVVGEPVRLPVDSQQLRGPFVRPFDPAVTAEHEDTGRCRLEHALSEFVLAAELCLQLAAFRHVPEVDRQPPLVRVAGRLKPATEEVVVRLGRLWLARRHRSSVSGTELVVLEPWKR